MSYSKMYIAVLDGAPDYMVPTLIAHTAIAAHIHFTGEDEYEEWLKNSYRKVVVRVNKKEFNKIQELHSYTGHENTICNGGGSCIFVSPVNSTDVPNVLKFAKLWKPKTEV